MRGVSNTWGIILAGGDGTRLREVTTTRTGDIIPKQFCSLQSDKCLLEQAIARAQVVAADRHICTVVAEQHRRWWRTVLKGLPVENVVAQPKNRGTANGVLLALVLIERRDPNAVVVLLPADHYVSDEGTMTDSLRAAACLAGENQSLIYLLGAEPDRPDPELGYIVPSVSRNSGPANVVSFSEKPSPEKARVLIRQGALWNTFIFAGSVRALLSLFEGHFDSTIEAMRQASKDELSGKLALKLLYEDLESYDFSRDVLERHEQVLQVLRVPSCGWTDLGTPDRVAEAVRRLARLPRQTQTHPSKQHLDLARCHSVMAARTVTRLNDALPPIREQSGYVELLAIDRKGGVSDFDIKHSENNILNWMTYLPPDCVQTMIHMGWDVST